MSVLIEMETRKCQLLNSVVEAPLFRLNRAVRVGFVVDRGVQVQLFLRVLHFCPVNIISLKLRSHSSFIHHRRCIIFANEAPLNKTLKMRVRKLFYGHSESHSEDMRIQTFLNLLRIRNLNSMTSPKNGFYQTY